MARGTLKRERKPKPTAKKQKGERGVKRVGILHSEHAQNILSEEEIKKNESLLIKEMIAG